MTRTIEHVITGLDIGGAELMLSNLARRGVRYRHSVTSLSGQGRIVGDLVANGVEVSEMGMKRNLKAVVGVRKLTNRLRKSRPAAVQTWLYHADLVGGFAARRAGTPVIWNLRQTNVGRGAQKWSTTLIVRLCAIVSKSLPVRIVCGSRAAREAHTAMGFHESNMVVISNGVDTDVFRHDEMARHEFRHELGVTDETLIVGRVGRYHPQKDYWGFVEMAAELRKSVPNTCFVLAGENVDWSNPELSGWIRKHGLSSSFRLLGARRDVAKVMSGLDLFVSSSAFGEGFPNVLAEALACEVPCIATDVGDSREILGASNRVVAPGDYGALAAAARDALGRPWETRCQIAKEERKRIARHFSMDSMIDSYEDLYDEVLAELATHRIDRVPRGGRC